MLTSSLRPTRVKADEYITKERIGAGQFGEVEKCEHKQSSKIYAVKTIMAPKLFLDAIEQQAMNMIKTNSEYVLELNDHFYDESLGAYVLVTPYYKLGSVQTLMKNKWEFKELLLFTYQISKALFDLSKNQILHLDLKPQNILIKGSGQYILCDLGCSRKLEANNMSMTRSINVLKMSAANARGGGTPEYASPDLIINGEMTPFTDIWSLGVILYKVIYWKHPLTILPSNLQTRMTDFYSGNFQIPFPENSQNEKFKPIIELMKRMLVCSKDNKKRITWAEILDKIYDLAHIPASQTNYIVTNFDLLLQFGDKVSILTSAALHYMDKLEQCLKSNKVSTASAVKESCIFLLTLTLEIIKHTKEVVQQNFQFYLFESTRKNLTKKQKSYAEFLEKEVIKLSKNYKVNIEYKVYNIARESLLWEYGKLSKELKKIKPPTQQIQSIEFKKLQKVLNFLADFNMLNYQNRKELIDFTKDLINN